MVNKKISKTCRQLAILHIFLCSKVIEIKEITTLIEMSSKTIMRDLKELQNAGLLNIRFSKKEEAYIHIDNDNRCPFSTPTFFDNKIKNMHLEKLIRLATIMIDLRYHTEVVYYHECSKEKETCSSWYKKRFPSLSTRTMQRDFKQLNEIGYEIKYDSIDKCYMVNFTEGIEGIEYWLDNLRTNVLYKE